MGKHKQAQRTKNNARPSSSSRSAELLGASMPNFVSFSAAKDGGYVPVLPGLTLSSVDDIDISKLDPNFQLLLKKMNKKDGTTKLKALQEFTELCKNSTANTIQSVLPFWPRIYCALAIDVEHRVREAAHIAHLAVVKPAGRNIAPYLKQLAGPWFTSQYDTYAPAASAATNSFQATFPPNKLTDAIVHCQEEILTYICDNITVQTPQTLGNSKTVTPEEMDMRYQRLLITSLQGYSLYLKTITPEQLEKVSHIHNKILSSNKFWKLAKHEVPLIRAGFFAVLASMIQHTNNLNDNEKKKLITAVMNNLDETDPAVLPVVWEAVLLVICKIQDWHSIVSVEKLILPKLWHVLRNGGHGSAGVIYPNLLPFISHFPTLNVDKTNLYTSFFENLRKGFKVKSVQLSNSEMLAVATSFVESLRYVVLLNHDNEILCETLLREQLMPTLEWCLTENSPIKQVLFGQISQIIRYWSKNRNSTEYKSYSYLVQQFWSQLETKLLSLTGSSEENFDPVHVSTVHDSVLDLLLSLKNNSVSKQKNLRVKFFDPDQKTKQPKEVVTNVAESDAIYVAELNRLIEKITSIHLENVENDSLGSTALQSFFKLVTNFENKQLFESLAKYYEGDTSLFKFYDKSLKKWLAEKPQHTEIVMTLLFSLIKHLDKSDKDAVLNSLTQIDNNDVLRHAVEQALLKHNKKDPAVKEWFSQSRVSSLLLDVANRIVTSEKVEDLNMDKTILTLCFENSDNEDLIISDATFDEIVSILCGAFSDEQNQNDLNPLAELVSDLCVLTWNHKQLRPGAIKILETLFEISCKEDLDLGQVVQNTWQTGLAEFAKKLLPPELVRMAEKCATILWEKIFESKQSQLAERLVNVAATFILSVVQEDEDNAYATDVIIAFMTGSRITRWLSDATAIVLYAELVSGNLSVLETKFETKIGHDIITIDLEQRHSADDIEGCVRWALFNIKLLKKLFNNYSETRDKSKDDPEETEFNDTMRDNALPVIKDTLANILYVIAVGYLYGRHYTSTEHHNSMNALLCNLREEFKESYTRFGSVVLEYNLNNIVENSRNYIGIWSHVLRLYCTELSPCNESAIYLKNYFNDTSSRSRDKNGAGAWLQAVQVLSDYLDPEYLTLELDNEIDSFVMSRSFLRNDVQEEYLPYFTKTFEKIMKLYQEDNSSLLFDCDISKASWENCVLPLEIIKFITKYVASVPRKLTHAQWDFILISLASWQLSVNKSRHSCDSLKVTAFIIAVDTLFIALKELLNKHEKEPINELPITMLDEWKNIFADDVYVVLVGTWMYCSDFYNQRNISSAQVILLDSLGKALKLVDEKIFFKPQTGATLGSINSEKLIKLTFKLLQSPVPSLQLSAYHALKKVIPELVARDKALIDLENFDPCSLNIRKFEPVLASTQNIVNAMLFDFKLCETVSCSIQPYTDSYTYTLGYLFEWAILLDMCSYAHSELRYQYSEFLKNDFFHCLLNNLFRLMPVEVLQDNKNKAVKLAEIFSTPPSFSFADSWTEWRLDHLVCWLYANSLRQLPVLVRQWWGAVDSRVSAAVERITTLYVSPMLCQEELQGNKFTDIENMQVKIHPTAREVIALYQVEDAKLELSIVLPVNHPLGPVTVEPGQHAGGGSNWRNCHMQLSIFLTHQNGSIWDGLTLWKNNLDKRFSGVEECYICFSIVHATTNQIPKLSCHTCRKKFHTPCLYKWFSTSQKSTCPICRNIF